MFTDKILIRSLLVSVLIHAIFLTNYRPFRLFHKQKFLPKDIELTYYRKTVSVLPETLISNKEKITAAALPAKRKNFIDKAIKPSNKMHKAILPATEKMQLAKPVSNRQKMLIYNKSEDLSGNPSYLKYHNIIRSKIERMVNAYKPRIFDAGEVSMVFIIQSSGDLKQVDLLDKNSSGNKTLTQCAIDGIYAASPFPPFTQDMEEKELTLQVAISFEK